LFMRLRQSVFQQKSRGNPLAGLYPKGASKMPGVEREK
jgi:hypothetical protein